MTFLFLAAFGRLTRLVAAGKYLPQPLQFPGAILTLVMAYPTTVELLATLAKYSHKYSIRMRVMVTESRFLLGDDIICETLVAQ